MAGKHARAIQAHHAHIIAVSRIRKDHSLAAKIHPAKTQGHHGKHSGARPKHPRVRHPRVRHPRRRRR